MSNDTHNSRSLVWTKARELTIDETNDVVGGASGSVAPSTVGKPIRTIGMSGDNYPDQFTPTD